MTILPGETACLACLMTEAPPPGTTPTCDTAGILAPIVNVIASIEACEALKILSGHREAASRRLTIVDLWDNQMRHVDLSRLRDDGDCRVCKHGEFEWLSGERADATAVLCGRNAVQLSPPPGTQLSLRDLAARLDGRRPNAAKCVPVAAGRRRLRADRLPRWPHDRRRHERHRHGPHGACTLHRGVIAAAFPQSSRPLPKLPAHWQPVRASRRTFSFSWPARPIHSAAARAGSRSHPAGIRAADPVSIGAVDRAKFSAALRTPLSQRCQQALLSRAAALGVRFSCSHRSMATVESPRTTPRQHLAYSDAPQLARPARAVAIGAAA